jgi:putative ABC transport system substrate-binding protein
MGIALLAAPLFAAAQSKPALPVIGYLEAPPPALVLQLREAFGAGLREHGWIEGKNVRVEYRSAEGRPERFPEMVAEMVRLKVSVMVVSGEPTIAIAKQATSTIPIVMAAVGDPVGRGFVASLARPGGNITGVSNFAVGLTSKWVELLLEVVPGLTKIAVLRNPANPSHAAFRQEAEQAARSRNVQVLDVGATTVEEIEPAFAAIVKERAGALIVVPDPLFGGQRLKVGSLANRHRVPWITLFRDYGPTMSYGPSLLDNHRRAAAYVDKILKGAEPAELPIQQATRFELAINLRTAKALGLTVPPTLLARADEVIE